MRKWVYTFGDGVAEGSAADRNHLGGKGANLAEMCNLGLPVPPGFTIVTDACSHYYDSGRTIPEAIREQVSSAIDVIVQLTRLRDGTRRVTSLTEVHGMEGQTITMQDVFEFDYSAGIAPDGRYLGSIRPTGVRPGFTQKFDDLGIHLSPGVFGNGSLWSGGHR